MRFDNGIWNQYRVLIISLFDRKIQGIFYEWQKLMRKKISIIFFIRCYYYYYWMNDKTLSHASWWSHRNEHHALTGIRQWHDQQQPKVKLACRPRTRIVVFASVCSNAAIVCIKTHYSLHSSKSPRFSLSPNYKISHLLATVAADTQYPTAPENIPPTKNSWLISVL